VTSKPGYQPCCSLHLCGYSQRLCFVRGPRRGSPGCRDIALTPPCQYKHYVCACTARPSTVACTLQTAGTGRARWPSAPTQTSSATGRAPRSMQLLYRQATVVLPQSSLETAAVRTHSSSSMHNALHTQRDAYLATHAITAHAMPLLPACIPGYAPGAP